jgi:hypothetical protein
MRIRTPISSDFEALLADFFDTADETNQAPKPSHRFSISSLEAAWGVAAQARVTRPQDTTHRDARRIAYGDESEALHGASLDPHRILSELGLHRDATEAEISVLRREFALRNHPDRVPSELRDIATQRMMIANDLMDRHIAMLRRPTG